MSAADALTTQCDSDDEFEDASTSFQRSSDQGPIGHERGMVAIETAIDLMHNNKYFEAEAMLKPWADTSMYHSMAHCTILFIQAVMSNDPESIEQATSAVNTCVGLCNRNRKNKGVLEALSSWVFGSNLDEYTVGELTAEIFYAESNLMLSFITFLQDENLLSFLKGALRVRSCHSLYKQLYTWMQNAEQQGKVLEPNFAAGVRLGVGCFNLFISALPARVLRLLEFVGFSGNRAVGLELLTLGAESGTFRASFCTSYLLFYHTVGSVMLGISDLKTDVSERLLQPQLEKYPSSPLFLYFKGRLALMQGNVNKAIEALTTIIEEHTQWKQVHHLAWWELMWCHCFKSEWALGASYADKLFVGSKWSKATFLYQKAALMLMLRPSGQGNQRGASAESASMEDIAEWMKKIPKLKQRIAGKSLPVEKLAVAKAERYLQGGRLPLAVLEMVYAWNGFRLLAQDPPLVKNMLTNVWSELTLVEETKDENPFYVDDYVVVMLIQGVCFRSIHRYDEAEKCFKSVLKRSSQVQHDHYAVAAANMELGLLYLDTGRVLEAESALETTKSSYKGYHLESRLHFRIHAGLSKIAELKAARS